MDALLALIFICNVILVGLVVGIAFTLWTTQPSHITQNKQQLIDSSSFLRDSLPVVEVSPYGGRPWGKESQFIDETAVWIWGEQTAVHPRWVFFKTFEIKEPSAAVHLHVIADRKGAVYIDEKLVAGIKENGWMTPNYTKKHLGVLSKGVHLITIYVENVSGTGGLLAALVQGQTTLLKTSGEWKCKKLYA